MERLGQIARSVQALGEPLAVSWRSWKDKQIALFPGQVSLLVAAPGVGKTTIALNIARAVRPRRVFYVLVDTDPMDIVARSTAMVTSQTMPAPEARLGFIEYFREEVAAEMDHVTWYTSGGPSLDEINDEIECYGAVYGANPELMFVDNLTSVDMDAETSFNSLQDTISRFTRAARATGMHIMILHHAVKAYSGGEKIIPQDGIEQDAAKRVSLALTATRMGNSLRVAVVKNRGGSADASGQRVYAMLTADLERMQIKDQDHA